MAACASRTVLNNGDLVAIFDHALRFLVDTSAALLLFQRHQVLNQRMPPSCTLDIEGSYEFTIDSTVSEQRPRSIRPRRTPG